MTLQEQIKDLKERITNESIKLWEKIEESPVYNQLMDRYQNLEPRMQKVTQVAGVVTAGLILFSIPYGYYSSSQEFNSEFETKRALIRDLNKAYKEGQSAPRFAIAPEVNSLKSQIEAKLGSSQLLPEQNKGVEITNAKSDSIPSQLIQGVIQVTLEKLNLKQVIDIGHQLHAMNPAVKMLDLEMQATTGASLSDRNYFNVVYKLALIGTGESTEMDESEPVEEETAVPSKTGGAAGRPAGQPKARTGK